MASYAVLWQELGVNTVYSGCAKLDGSGLTLQGRSSGRLAERFIPEEELSEVVRERTLRIGAFEAFRLVTRDGYSLLLAAPFGIGALAEIFEQVTERIA